MMQDEALCNSWWMNGDQHRAGSTSASITMRASLPSPPRQSFLRARPARTPAMGLAASAPAPEPEPPGPSPGLPPGLRAAWPADGAGPLPAAAWAAAGAWAAARSEDAAGNGGPGALWRALAAGGGRYGAEGGVQRGPRREKFGTGPWTNVSARSTPPSVAASVFGARDAVSSRLYTVLCTLPAGVVTRCTPRTRGTGSRAPRRATSPQNRVRSPNNNAVGSEPSDRVGCRSPDGVPKTDCANRAGPAERRAVPAAGLRRCCAR